MSTTRRTQEWPALVQRWPPCGCQHLLLAKAKTRGMREATCRTRRWRKSGRLRMARASAHTRHADGHISGRKRHASVSLAMPSRRCEAYPSVVVLHARVWSLSSWRKIIDELKDIAIRVSSLSQAL
eukprot:1641672-Pyramimonas_sp.AAC.1